MNAPARINSALNVRDQLPAIENWHYLDSAATAQKPQAVIDTITEAYARDYATVHRGVYQRSSMCTAMFAMVVSVISPRSLTMTTSSASGWRRRASS